MLEQLPSELVATLLADIGVSAAKGVFGYFGRNDAATDLAKPKVSPKEDEFEPDPVEYGNETPQFLARQRLHHRIDLARAKWAWLVAATYYHATRGRPQEIASRWQPRAIAGHFTVSDFSSRDLPHESYIGETAASDIRLTIIQGHISIASNLRDTLDRLDDALARTSVTFDLPKAPWSDRGILLPWVSLVNEIRHRNFAGLPQFNSFCGFTNLWSVRDTPAFGIRSRESGALTPAYAYVAEMAWYLAQHDSHLGRLYSIEFEKKHALPHQYALRRVAVAVLDAIWEQIGSTLVASQQSAKSSNKATETDAKRTRGSSPRR